MDAVKQVYLLLICQGFYLASVCQKWTFPSRITALIGSCVEIPCTYQPARFAGTSSPVWYLDKYKSTDPEILNTEDSSSVLEEFKNRTSLGTSPGWNGCTLRIDPVRREDGGEYYPGIAEDRHINAYKRQSKSVSLHVTEKVNVWLYWSRVMTEGEATEIRCTAAHTCRSSPPSLQLNKPGRIRKKTEEISDGSWREESEFIYIPSYVDDGSPVQCTATYPNGNNFEASGRLNIMHAPKNVTVTITGMEEVIEGSDVRLQCNSFSNPAVYEYEWYKGKTKLPDRGREITVRNVTWNMEPYSCAARNRLGTGESDLTEIPVQNATIRSNIIVKKEHEFTELICDVPDSQPDVTHYTWMKDGSILHNETGKILTIYNNEENYRKYSCFPHNNTEDSSLEETCRNCDPQTLPLILGTVAGVFGLLFFILVMYFFLRRKKKPAFPASPIHGTLSVKETMPKDEILYGNIQRDHQAEPPSMRSDPSVNMKLDGNYVIYSNSEALQPSFEVEYSTIAHGQPDQARLSSSRARNAEVVEYATLKH